MKLLKILWEDLKVLLLVVVFFTIVGLVAYHTYQYVYWDVLMYQGGSRFDALEMAGLWGFISAFLSGGVLVWLASLVTRCYPPS